MKKKRIKKRLLSKYDGKKQEWLHLTLTLLLVAALTLAAFSAVFGISTVSGTSMEPNFHPGDVVIYLRLGYTPQLGDVVAMTMPSGESYIKRIAALPGDTLDIRDGTLFRNDTPEYPAQTTTHQSPTVTFPLTIPQGRYFVLGDNRASSIDSRTFGTITQKQLLGRVLLRLPLS